MRISSVTLKGRTTVNYNKRWLKVKRKARIPSKRCAKFCQDWNLYPRFAMGKPWLRSWGDISEKVVLRCSKYFSDYSEVRSTANPKLAFRTQTVHLRPFRFTTSFSA
jgi:hypothetical protein